MGDGPAIVLIHGGSASSVFWRKQLEGLSSRFRVIALDNRGHGRSEKTEAGHTIASYARDVEHLIRRLDLSQVVLVGWSMGFPVCLSYVEQFGHSGLAGLVDVDHKPHLGTEADLQVRVRAVEADRPRLHRERLLDFFAAPPAPSVVDVMMEAFLQTPTSTYLQTLVDVWRRDFTAVFPTIDVPVLIVTSEHGQLGETTARRIAQAIPDARVSVFPHCGHLLFWEEPERFNREVSAFVLSLVR